MPKVKIDAKAPDFTLANYQGDLITLSNFESRKNVLLVFNRGFFWPYCQKHMAQLRQTEAEFEEHNTEVLVAGPDNAEKFKTYFEEHNLSFQGLPDPKHSVLKLYGQQIKLFKLGRMPAQVLIDKSGIVRFGHYGHDMRDIPKPAEMLDLIQTL